MARAKTDELARQRAMSERQRIAAALNLGRRIRKLKNLAHGQ